MKKNKILTSVFTFALLITLTATLEVKAYSKTLTNDDYCYYKSGSQTNEGFRDRLTYKEKQTSVQIEVPKGYGSITIVSNGNVIATVDGGKSTTIKKDKIKDEIHYYRKTTSNIYPIGEKNKKKHTAKTCALGYTKITSSSCKVSEQDKENLQAGNKEGKRNYNNGTTSIIVTTNDNYYAKVFISDNGMKKNEKKITRNGDSYYIANKYLNGNSSVSIHLEYYFKKGECKNKYAFEADKTVSGFKKNNVKDACSKLDDKIKNNIEECSGNYLDNDSNVSPQEISIQQKLISSIGNTEYGNKKLASCAKSASCKTSANRTKENLTCQFNPEKNKTKDYEYTEKTEVNLPGYEKDGPYFTKVCVETVKVEYDTPKLVSTNGGGFKYDIKVKPTVTCYARIRDDAWEKLYKTGGKCKLEHECYGYDNWDTDYYDNGSYDGGPNEDFDACVKTCDGGKYSQSCINSCYNEVYKNKTTTTYSIFDKKSLIKHLGSNVGYSDNKTKYSDEWCTLPPSSGSGHFTGNYKNGTNYYVSDHTFPGSYECVSARKENEEGTSTESINILRFFKTLSCGSKCKTIITGSEGSVTLADENVYSSVVVDSDNYLEEVNGKPIKCFLNKSGASINKKKLEAFKKAWENLKTEVEEYNTGKKEDKDVTYTYKIHDSQKEYCDTNNKNYITYKKGDTTNPLYVEEKKTTKDNVVTTDTSLGFPNTCLKNGSVKNKPQSNTCCNLQTDGLPGDKKFYMSYTTEGIINNVQNWPTSEKTDFTDGEKTSINNFRKQIETNTGGIKLKVWDTDNAKLKNVCETSGDYKRFNYNINATLEKVGILGKDNGWNFNIDCFYGYIPEGYSYCKPQISDKDLDGDGEVDTTVINESICCSDDSSCKDNVKDKELTEIKNALVSKYFYRTVNLSDPFENMKEEDIAWNWKDSKTTAAANENIQALGVTTYKLSPTNTRKFIKETGYAYQDYKNFTFNVTKDTLKAVRNYNNDHSVIAMSETSCDSKSSGFGCQNKFIRNNSYYTSGSDISKGTDVYNNLRDKK